MKPDEQGFRSNARFDDATTNKTDYKPWEVQPLQTHRPDQYKKLAGEMDLNTMYNSEFTPKGFAKVEAIRPVERHGVNARFDGSTTYAGDYKQWPEGRQAAIRASNSYVPPSVPFEGMSTYRGNFEDYTRLIGRDLLGHYIQHDADTQRSFKPDGVAYRSSAPFDDTTMYKTEFTRKEVEPCPACFLE